MFANIDWDVIVRSLPYLFLDGMRFTIILTLLATAGGVRPAFSRRHQMGGQESALRAADAGLGKERSG